LKVLLWHRKRSYSAGNNDLKICRCRSSYRSVVNWAGCVCVRTARHQKTEVKCAFPETKRVHVDLNCREVWKRIAFNLDYKSWRSAAIIGTLA